MDLKPTAEQVQALDIFRKGFSMAIEAGAGTGKTSTLRLIAETTKRRGQYVAFNRSIVKEAASKMPQTVISSTAHSLAFRAVGRDYAPRLDQRRMRSAEIARRLGVSPIFVKVDGETKVLQPGYLGGLVMRTVINYCRTADPEPTAQHVPYIKGIDLSDGGKRTYHNNRAVAEQIQPWVKKAWADVLSLAGQLPFRHDHYLKIWQLGNPKINCDYLLFDEAQDADPVVAAVVANQDCQKVYVGDRNQEIYSWRGAVDALSEIRLQDVEVAFLTNCFRFGPEIAEVANEALDLLDAEIRLTGRGPGGTVGPLAEVDCILTRTNATGVQTFLSQIAAGQKPHLLGGGSEVLAFARAAQSLMEQGWTAHPDLACFQTWLEVQTYADQDELGGELKLLVTLVDQFGAERIAESIEKMPEEISASTVISTAHKAKGREWNAVRLAEDFPEEPGEAELRLLYVAVTRARQELDCEQTILKAETNVQEVLPA